MFAPLALVILGGLIVGSFLNVCIFRLPKGESVVFPRSRCPSCGRAIRPWENVPVLSYLLLKGRCRGCGQPISWVYPAVEILTAACFALLFLKYGFAPPFFVNALFFGLLIPLVFIDLFERILPDVMTISGTVIGFLLAPFQSREFLEAAGSISVQNPVVSSYVNSLAGIVFGGGFLWLVAYLYLRIRRIEGMGFGDVKMMGMVGAFLGWQFSWLTILLGSLVGAVVGGCYIWLAGEGRRYELPFGSFLGFAAILVTLGGAGFLGWYLGLLLVS